MDGLPLLEKNFYNEFPSVRAKTEVEVNECRLCRKITVEGKYVPNFVKTFSDAAFPGTSFIVILNFFVLQFNFILPDSIYVQMINFSKDL
jgi:hypothetical protein